MGVYVDDQKATVARSQDHGPVSSGSKSSTNIYVSPFHQNHHNHRHPHHGSNSRHHQLQHSSVRHVRGKSPDDVVGSNKNDFRPSHNDQIVSTAMVHENSDANASDRLLYEEVGAGKTKSAEEIVPSNGCSPDHCHPKSRRRRRYGCSRVAIAGLSFAFACSLAAIVGLVWKLVNVTSSSSLPPSSPESLSLQQTEAVSKSNVCLTADCVTAAAAILESLDQNVDPCEDFYSFVCNGWIEKHPIPKGQSTWSVTDQRSEDNFEILRSLLERPLDYRSSKSEQKAQLLYRSCLDSFGRLEELGAGPLHDLIEEVGGWNLSSFGKSNSRRSQFDDHGFDLRSKLLRVQRFNSDALFTWHVREGAHNTSQYELFIHQGGLSLPSKDMYHHNSKYKAALFRFISSVVELLGSRKEDHVEEILSIIEFESILANFSTREHEITGMFIPLERLDQFDLFPRPWGSWRDFFNQIINQTLEGNTKKRIHYLRDDTMVWIQHRYLVQLGALMSLYPDDKQVSTSTNGVSSINNLFFGPSVAENETRAFHNLLNNYLTWRAIMPFIGYLSKDFQRAMKSFSKSLRGTVGREERWHTCVINTNNALGFAVAPAFVREAFSEGSRQKAHEMITEIKEAFKERLKSLDWVDPKTASQIRLKIDRTNELFGYPDVIMNATALDSTYELFWVSEREFFQNQVRLHRFILAKNLQLLGTDVDKSDWPIAFPPSTVNAFYMYARNQILFPAGVLQPPLFSETQPMSLNFGHIGTFMGHEILHGFDDTGRLYSPTGTKDVWWPNATSKAFANRSSCFVEQYTQEIFSGRVVDGWRTLSENIADNGGLLAAYQGYQSWAKRHTRAANTSQDDLLGLLPGLPYNHSQLMFLGFARVHCSSTKEKTMDLYLMTDRHSPSHVRVNTAVSNLQEFAEAWQCQDGATLKLSQADRCSLW